MDSPLDPLSMGGHNIALVRLSLRQLVKATRQQLALATGLSTVTVAAALDKLCARGEAREVSFVPSQGGRPSQLYRYDADFAHILVLFTREESGRDRAYLRALDLYGRIVAAEDLALSPPRLQVLEAPLDRMVSKDPLIRALGLGLPGIAAQGSFTALDYPDLVGLPIVGLIRDRYGLPVLFENDVNAAALGYSQAQPGSREASLAYLYFPQSHPPGAGIIVRGALHRGSRGWAGEIAHLPLGIDWADPGLYSGADRGSAVLARTVAAIAAVLNPERVVLIGEFLEPGQLGEIAARCADLLPPALVPALALSTDFSGDIQAGLSSLTLDLLEDPSPPGPTKG